MPSRTLLGMLTPSSNTTLEPVTTAMLAGLPEVSAHLPRFKVTEIALSGRALAQFDLGAILAAAELLFHAAASASDAVKRGVGQERDRASRRLLGDFQT